MNSVLKREAMDWVHEARTRNKTGDRFREEKLGEEGKGTDYVNKCPTYETWGHPLG